MFVDRKIAHQPNDILPLQDKPQGTFLIVFWGKKSTPATKLGSKMVKQKPTSTSGDTFFTLSNFKFHLEIDVTHVMTTFFKHVFTFKVGSTFLF